ncbi:MAG: SHOCT domain-containing protein [Patescibacteria group bacterium]|nr:SHOCT domain-containing protein [Patescibacteria group bacterium]
MSPFGQMRRVARRTSRRTSRRMAAANNESQAPEQETEDSTTSQLENLAKLKNEGIITEEEFDAKKKQILGI